MTLVTTTVPYLSLEAFKAEYEIRVATDDDAITRALASAAEAINEDADRTFYAHGVTGGDDERFYTPERPLTLQIDDCLEVFEVAIDRQGNGTFSIVFEENRDFVLEPLNALHKGKPFERIVLHPYGRFLQLPKLPRSVRVTARFGWPIVPDRVTQANGILANRLRLRKGTPWGIASFGTEVALRLLRSDPDLYGLLDGLRRDPVVY